MQQVLDESLADRRLDLVLLLAFAGVALALSAAGLYGVISYLVAQRTQEIGIRMALGARREEVVRLMLKHGLRLSAAGLVLGLGGAALLSRALRSLLYGVSNSDPATYATVTVLLAAVAMVATWIPARRAARVNPAIAMRAE
jgi:ABC-type antimicrobial peptide transport system permease subunit